jgi:hypothetical protein
MLTNTALREIVSRYLPCGFSSVTMAQGTPETDNDQMVSAYPHQLMEMARGLQTAIILDICRQISASE